MHLNYYFLKPLASRLNEILAGKILIETFSQEKDELVLIFAEAEEDGILINPFFIKATLRSSFTSLSFPEKFDRARRNSVNLFESVCGLKVIDVHVFLNERAFVIHLESGVHLVFKMYGNRSNIISYDSEGTVVELFNNKLSADQSLRLSSFDRPIDQTFEAFVANEYHYQRLFPTFGKVINNYVNELLIGVEEPEGKWRVIESVVQKLQEPTFYLVTHQLVPALFLFPIGDLISSTKDPIEALNAFYYAYVRLSGLDKEKADIQRILNKRLAQTENYLDHTFKKLLDLESAIRNDEIANIIMANLHQIAPRSESVELYDFYRDQPIRIKLKKDFSPQKNAEGYYRKAKNEKIEIDRLNDSLTARESEKLKLQAHLIEISKIDILRDLRSYIKKNGLLGDSNVASPQASELFKKVEFMGYTILIGRNAKNNDVLTKQYAFKEDLWLHARDVSGSHVVIKNQPGKKIPAPVIERAAELAAFYSKRKNDSLCPVIVTPKKYVRKLKGMPEGAVIVDKEEVVMVVSRGE